MSRKRIECKILGKPENLNQKQLLTTRSVLKYFLYVSKLLALKSKLTPSQDDIINTVTGNVLKIDGKASTSIVSYATVSKKLKEIIAECEKQLGEDYKKEAGAISV